MEAILWKLGTDHTLSARLDVHRLIVEQVDGRSGTARYRILRSVDAGEEILVKSGIEESVSSAIHAAERFAEHLEHPTN